jgi:hypothetical protein
LFLGSKQRENEGRENDEAEIIEPTGATDASFYFAPRGEL